MARLRFPGRPGCRFGRSGIRYAADEIDILQDPVLAWVANIHRGLRQFRELCGESDEDEEFEGFSAEDVKQAEKKLKKLEADLQEDSEVETQPQTSQNVSFSPTSPPKTMSTRFSRQKENIENLPTAQRTRNREKTVVPRSYKDLLKKGITKPSKSYLIKSKRDNDTPQTETRKALAAYYKTDKVTSPEMGGKYYEQGFKIKKSGRFRGARVIFGIGRPKYLMTVERKWYIPTGPPCTSEDEEESPQQKQIKKRKERDKKIHIVSTVVKKGSKSIARTLLDKAKKGKDEISVKKIKKVPVKKQFVLPTQSSRSSRVIIPNKRFLEQEDRSVLKKRKENLFDTSLSPSFQQPFTSTSSNTTMEKLTIQTEFPTTGGFGSFSPSIYRKASLFDQPLITEGKRERKPSQKLKGTENGFQSLSASFSPEDSRKVHLTPSKLGQSIQSSLSPPIRIAPPKFGNTPFRSLTQQNNDIEATKRSGHNILRKAKLQLNRTALNKSKAALAKSLKKEMKREERKKKRLDEGNTGYSTYTASSTNYMDRQGPENDPDQVEAPEHICQVCRTTYSKKAKMIRSVICISCYKFYKRYPHIQKEPCKYSGACSQPESEQLCKPCRFRKACTHYLTAIGKPVPKFRIKKPKTISRSTVLLQKKSEKVLVQQKKQPSYLEMIHTSVGELMDMDAPPSPPSSPQPDKVDKVEQSDVTSSPDSHTVSPVADVRGPRIKHVCRKAAVVLGKTIARFPESELTLSALPKVEKKKILRQDELDKAAYSDDEKTIEEIIQDAEEGVDTVIRSPPVKVIPKIHKVHKSSPIHQPHTNIQMLKSKRKLRCRKCANCLAPDCGKCRHCLDKPKFGGRGVMKQACMKKTCTNPQYFKAGTATIPLKDSSDAGCSSDYGSEMNNNSNSGKSCLNVLGRFSQKSSARSSQQLEFGREGFGRTPAEISRQLQFNERSSSSQGAPHQLTNISRASRGQGSGRIVTKMPPLRPTEQTMSRRFRSSSYRWSKIKQEDQEKHRLKADFKEKYSEWSAWQFGVALTVANPLCCRTVCFLCGSAGKHELFYCNVCCEPFHEFCLEDYEKPSSDNLENWVCRKCQFCTVCGQQKNLLKCDKCQNTYHPECLGPNYPTKPSKNKNIWICTKCVKCKSCGATTPGTTSNATWMYDFQLCHVCGLLMDKGNFCPICHKCYSDDDWDCKMVQCARCESWVHASCEGLSDEMYERVSCLPEDVHYICKMCAGSKVRHWELVLRDDFIAGIKSIFYSIYHAKCSQFLEVKKKEEDAHIIVDDSSNDSSCKVQNSSSNSVAKGIEGTMKKDAIISCDKIVEYCDDNVIEKSKTSDEEIMDKSRTCEHPSDAKLEPVAMETDERKGDNLSVDCDSKVVSVCDKDSSPSKRSDEPDGNKSYLLKTSPNVELFIKNLEGIVEKRAASQVSPNQFSAINIESKTESKEALQSSNVTCENNITVMSPCVPTENLFITQSDLSQTAQINHVEDNSLCLNADSNSSNASSENQIDVIHKTPEKKGAVVRFSESTPKPEPTRDYPEDLLSVRQKIIAGGYTTVEEFSEDIAFIIETALTYIQDQSVVRKKAINSVRSIFVKQMEKCFPWYNVKACRMWEHNRFLPQNMLPQAVLPPFDDHTYAQWLERESKLLSPQPSPFKKVMETPIKKLFPIVDPDEEGEKVLSSDLADDGQDTRRCILCWHYGDADLNREGRLLYSGQDDWVHVNCALWSAEVYEEGKDGALQNVHEAISRGKKMKCDNCQRTGATVGCCTRGCPANYHFMCARLDGGLFQEDKKVFCSQHKDKVDGMLVSKDKFAVLRRVCVDGKGLKITKKSWTKGLLAAAINILIGSCTIESLGHLTALSDCKGLILPVGFSCTRVYWSTKDARRRCVYTCRIVEVRPDLPKSPKATIKDMTIIHDESHPDYVPLSELDIPGINLYPQRKRANIIDLTDDDISTHSEDSSRTLSAFSSCEKPRSRSFDGNDSLSSSWPIPKKKPRTDPVPRDLSMLSPTTLRLLNKDPEKYKVKRGEVSEPSNKPAVPPLPVIDESPLAQIASRLNTAAAKNRQKSEDRILPGAKTLVIPERPSSCPTLPRSRSNSVEKVLSPPQLCSSPNALPQTQENQGCGSIVTSYQNTESYECSFDMDESLKSIIEELSSSGEENAIIVISENGELSEEDYAMIAQYTNNQSGQIPEISLEQSIEDVEKPTISKDLTGNSDGIEVVKKLDSANPLNDKAIGTEDATIPISTNSTVMYPKTAHTSSPIRLGAGTEIVVTKEGLSVQKIGSAIQEGREIIDSATICKQKPVSTATVSAVDLTFGKNASSNQCIDLTDTDDDKMETDEESKEKEDCPVLEKSSSEQEAENEDVDMMPVLTVESPMKHKLDTSVTPDSAKRVLDVEKPQMSQTDGRNNSTSEKMYSPPRNFNLRDSEKYVLNPETGDFVPKEDSPEKTPSPKPDLSNAAEKVSREDTKGRNLFEAMQFSSDSTEDHDHQKTEILKGLGLERTPPEDVKPKQQRKSYPLRRRSMFSDEEEQPEVSLHVKLSEKIKAESLARSSPGEEGPFKCPTCKRHYRTRESYQTHVNSCDFDVSSTTDEEEVSEEDKEANGRKKYPMRESTIVQSVVSQAEEQERRCGFKKTGKPLRSRDLSPKVMLDRLAPSEYSSKKSGEDCDLTSPPVKRGRGRPPKNPSHSTETAAKPLSSSKSSDPKSDEPSRKVTSPVQETEPKKRGRPSLHKTSDKKSDDSSKPKPEETNDESDSDPKPRGRGRPPKSCSKTVIGKPRKQNLRTPNDEFISARKHGNEQKSVSDNPYARQYLFKKTSVNYNMKLSVGSTHSSRRSLPFMKRRHLKTALRRRTDVSIMVASKREKRKSSDISSSSKESNKSKEQSKDFLKDKLADLEEQIKRKRGRPRKYPSSSSESKVKNKDINDGSSDAEENEDEIENVRGGGGSSEDEQEKGISDVSVDGDLGNESTDEAEKSLEVTENNQGSDEVDGEPKSKATTEKDQVESEEIKRDVTEHNSIDIVDEKNENTSDHMDKEIKQEILDEDYGKESEEKAKGESNIIYMKNASLGTNKETSCKEVEGGSFIQLKDPRINSVDTGLGTVSKPYVIDDEDDTPVQPAKSRGWRRRERTPNKFDIDNTIPSIKSSPAVKALSNFLAQKEKTPPKNEAVDTRPLLAPKPVEGTEYSHSRRSSESGSSHGSSPAIEMNRRLSDDIRKDSDSGTCRTRNSSGHESSRSRNSSGHSEERNIFQVINKTSPQGSANPYMAIKPVAECSRLPSKGPPPLMTPSLIGLHNPPTTASPAASLTAFQKLQQVPQAIQHIQQLHNRSTPAIIQYNPPAQVVSPVQNFTLPSPVDQLTLQPSVTPTNMIPIVYQQPVSVSSNDASQFQMPLPVHQGKSQSSTTDVNLPKLPSTSSREASSNVNQLGIPLTGSHTTSSVASVNQERVPSSPFESSKKLPISPQRTFDINEHISRMIEETTMAAGAQNPVIKQLISSQDSHTQRPSVPDQNMLLPQKIISPVMEHIQTLKPGPNTPHIIKTPQTKLVPYSQFIEQKPSTSVTKSSPSSLIPLTQLMEAGLKANSPSAISPRTLGNSPKQTMVTPGNTSTSIPHASIYPTPSSSSFPGQSSVVPHQKTGGAKPSTIVRIFVDGKPVALTTDPTVLQDHKSLLNKLGSSQIQSGTYSVTVSAHRVPSTSTSPISNNAATSTSPKVPAIQQVSRSSLSQPSSNSVSIPSTVTDMLDSQLVSAITSGNPLSPGKQEQLISALINHNQQNNRSLHSYSRKPVLPPNIQELIRKLSPPTVSVQPKVTTSYVKKPDGTIQKKTLVKPMVVNRKRPAINPISLTGSASKKPMISTYQEKNGTVQGLLSKVVMRKLVKDGSPRHNKVDGATQSIVEDSMCPKRKLKEKLKKKKTPRKNNIHKPHAGAGTAHPMIHGVKESMKIPQPALEEEVTESSMATFLEHQQRVQEKVEKLERDGAHLMFEISSDDGFSCKAESMEEAWKQVTDKVQDTRTTARLKHLSCASVHGMNMFGLNHNAVSYLLEQLYGAHLCRNYNFRYQQYSRTEEEEEPIENPTGSVRSEGFQSRKEFDIFSFLMSQYRHHPVMDMSDNNNEMNLKSQRRATSMDLPMAMRFRKLKEHSREAVGVYRSFIHGRGLFCKRNIDAGEMIIEYSGEVIRATLTDKREKYYESKGIGCYMFRIDDTDVVDATLHGSAARFINHSCDPNCYSKVIQVEGKKHIVIFAMRQIKKGEELTYDYKFPIEEVKIPCTCGSKRCRKYLN